MQIKIFIAGTKGADRERINTEPLVIDVETDKKDSSFNKFFQDAVAATVIDAYEKSIPVSKSLMHFVVLGEGEDKGKHVKFEWTSPSSQVKVMDNYRSAWSNLCSLVFGHGEDLELRKTKLPLFIGIAEKFGYKEHGGEVVIERLLSAQDMIFKAAALSFKNQELAGQLDGLRNGKVNIVGIEDENKKLKEEIKVVKEELRVKLISSTAASLRAGQP